MTGVRLSPCAADCICVNICSVSSLLSWIDITFAGSTAIVVCWYSASGWAVLLHVCWRLLDPSCNCHQYCSNERLCLRHGSAVLFNIDKCTCTCFSLLHSVWFFFLSSVLFLYLFIVVLCTRLFMYYAPCILYDLSIWIGQQAMCNFSVQKWVPLVASFPRPTPHCWHWVTLFIRGKTPLPCINLTCPAELPRWLSW